MTRLHGWPERLAEFIEMRRHVPFSWHDNDCWSFPAAAIHIMTGDDLFTPFRDKYGDAAGAARIIADAGGMRALCPLASKPLNFATFGDLVLVNLEGRDTAGVVVRGLRWCAPGPDGLVFRPLREAIDVMAV